MKAQINLRLSDDLRRAAERYVKVHKFKNIQDFAQEAIREKVMRDKNYDESFTEKEIELIDRLIETSIKKGKIRSEKELMKALE